MKSDSKNKKETDKYYIFALLYTLNTGEFYGSADGGELERFLHENPRTYSPRTRRVHKTSKAKLTRTEYGQILTYSYIKGKLLDVYLVEKEKLPGLFEWLIENHEQKFMRMYSKNDTFYEIVKEWERTSDSWIAKKKRAESQNNMKWG